MGNEELQSKKRAIELYDSGKINEYEEQSEYNVHNLAN